MLIYHAASIRTSSDNYYCSYFRNGLNKTSIVVFLYLSQIVTIHKTYTLTILSEALFPLVLCHCWVGFVFCAHKITKCF